MSSSSFLVLKGEADFTPHPCFTVLDPVVIEITDFFKAPKQTFVQRSNHTRFDEEQLSSLFTEFGTSMDVQRQLIPQVLSSVSSMPPTRTSTTSPPNLTVPVVVVRFYSAAVDNLKKVVFDGSGSIDQCAICLEKFQIGSEVSGTDCGHLFHRDCVAPWLKRRDSCPMCRRKI